MLKHDFIAIADQALFLTLDSEIKLIMLRFRFSLQNFKIASGILDIVLDEVAQLIIDIKGAGRQNLEDGIPIILEK